MSNYVKSTNFTSKDSLPLGDPLKIVKGTEIDTEFNNIATAVATKADIASPTFTGTPAAPTASPGTNTTQLATTAFVDAAVTALSLGTISTQNANNVTITGGSVTGITDLAVADGGTGASDAATARSNLGTNNAANITTGTVATARLGSGTADSTTFLRGDQSWVNPFPLAQSSLLTGAAGASYTHGLGSVPRLFGMQFVCKNANNGYSAGDVIPYQDSDGDGGRSSGIYADTTEVVFVGNTVYTRNKGNTSAFQILPNTDWEVRFWTIK